MRRCLAGSLAAVSMTLIVSCTSLTVAPGANKVRVTGDAADVTTCKAVGNIKVPEVSPGVVSPFVAQTQFRNLAVGLGSDVALVTQGSVGVPITGIGYRCN
jgi:hypothetical protein